MADFIGEFRDVLTRGEDLPTLPVVVLELHATLDDEVVSDVEIASIIMRDPPLATRLLRLANSAAFNRGTPVAEVQSAVQVLGLRQVSALCLALAVVKSFSHRRGGLNHRAFWKHSAGVALTTRELARCLGYTAVPPEQLYVGGLLHDVGLLLLDQYFPARFQQSMDTAERGDEPLWRIEDGALGMDHGEAGALLLGRWSLPESIVSMVAAHHQPKSAPESNRDACWLVHAAEVLCSGFGMSLDVERLAPARALTMLETIRSADYDVEALLEEATAGAGDFVSILE